MSACPFTRRAVLEVGLFGAAALATRPGAGLAGTLDRQHTLELEVPILAEDSTAVPVRLSTEHPMEPDHFIRSIEIVLERDPVPYKGTYRFTPANGQAGISFPMRSGVGGFLKATAECSARGSSP